MRPYAEKNLCFSLFFGLILCALFARAQTPIKVPDLTGRIVDLTATLDSSQQQTLEQRLQAFEQEKGTQMTVLIVPATGAEPIEQFSMRVAEQWQLGRKKIDDGAILVIAKNERKLRIEVGYGLEGALNDAVSKRIIDEVIVPAFQRNDFYGGISAGIDAMMRVVAGEPLPEPAGKEDWQVSGAGLLPLIFFAALVVGGLMRALLGRVKGALAASGLLGLGVWLLSGIGLLAFFSAVMGLVITLAGGRMGSGWQAGRRQGGFNPSGDFDGLRHHGWGDFRGGGGGFGGGGASGKW
ncbi:MAG: YgcG family protein [Oxalobacteraceae bacterium]|jgi:uncharacterized protein|nr:YgcG family protein [Oxalobacteraceae bacterium]